MKPAVRGLFTCHDLLVQNQPEKLQIQKVQALPIARDMLLGKPKIVCNPTEMNQDVATHTVSSVA